MPTTKHAAAISQESLRSPDERLAPLRMDAPVLVAADGSEAATAAVRIASHLAATRGARPEILTVLPPLPAPIGPFGPGLVTLPTDMIEGARRALRLEEIGRQLHEGAGPAARWPIAIDVGDPGRAIPEFALKRRASLVVMGLRAHGTLDRVFRAETTLNVMRRSPVPVLAVTPLMEGLPRRAIAAVDFSRASLRAARLALQVLARDGTLSLVHVRPTPGSAEARAEGLGIIYSHGVAGAFNRLVRELGAPPTVRIEPVILQGDVPTELLSLCDRAGADLIAIGSHRRRLIDRIVLGSVTAAVARAARCSMLVTPP